MPFPRMSPLQTLSRVRPTRHFPRPHIWQRSQRRQYADMKDRAIDSVAGAAERVQGAAGGAKGAAGKAVPDAAKKSDLPWLITAVAVTIPASYFVAQTGPMYNPFKHPLPGDNYHSEHGDEGHDEEDEEHEDGEGEKSPEGSEDAENNETKEDNAGDTDSDSSSDSNEDTPTTSDDEPSPDSDKSNDKFADKSDPAPGEEKRTNLPGKSIPGASDLQETKELEQGEGGETRLLMPSPKGGNKRRIESSQGIVQGRSVDDAEASTSEEGSIGDVKDGSTSAVGGQTPKQQKGISNTDTKHSTDQMKNPDMSKKPEGVPETAKIQGTVDPSRGKK